MISIASGGLDACLSGESPGGSTQDGAVVAGEELNGRGSHEGPSDESSLAAQRLFIGDAADEGAAVGAAAAGGHRSGSPDGSLCSDCPLAACVADVPDAWESLAPDEADNCTIGSAADRADSGQGPQRPAIVEACISSGTAGTTARAERWILHGPTWVRACAAAANGVAVTSSKNVNDCAGIGTAWSGAARSWAQF